MKLNVSTLINYHLDSELTNCNCQFQTDNSYILCEFHKGWASAFQYLDEKFDLFHLRMDGEYESL